MSDVIAEAASIRPAPTTEGERAAAAGYVRDACPDAPLILAMLGLEAG